MSCFLMCLFFWLLLAWMQPIQKVSVKTILPASSQDHFTLLFAFFHWIPPPRCKLFSLPPCQPSLFAIQRLTLLPSILWCPSPYPHFLGHGRSSHTRVLVPQLLLARLGRVLPLNALKANNPSNLSLRTHLSCDAYWTVSKLKPELGTSQI